MLRKLHCLRVLKSLWANQSLRKSHLRQNWRHLSLVIHCLNLLSTNHCPKWWRLGLYRTWTTQCGMGAHSCGRTIDNTIASHKWWFETTMQTRCNQSLGWSSRTLVFRNHPTPIVLSNGRTIGARSMRLEGSLSSSVTQLNSNLLSCKPGMRNHPSPTLARHSYPRWRMS